MQYLRVKLLKSLISHFGEDDRRIDHALRVTAWAEKIRETEPGDDEIVLAVGMLHDVGITEAEKRDGVSTGKLQEKYGPEIARGILNNIGFPPQKIEEVCAIVGKHHTPNGVDSPNFRILWDADMLVNIPEDMPDVKGEKLASIVEKSFRTGTGRTLAESVLCGTIP